MSAETSRIQSCMIERLRLGQARVEISTSNLYATHVGYQHALGTLIEALEAQIHNTGATPFGSSVHEVKVRLLGMVAHVAKRHLCARCTTHHTDAERRLPELIVKYAETAHAKGPDSYLNIAGTVLKPVSDASDGGESPPLLLLEAWQKLLPPPTTRRAKYSVVEMTPSAAAN